MATKRDEGILPCGCKYYINIDGELKIEYRRKDCHATHV